MSSPPLELRSVRLLLRRLRPSDAEPIAAYRALPEVSRFQSWSTFDQAAAQKLIDAQAGLAPDTPGTWIQLALVEASSGQLIGDCGIHSCADDPRQVELGITLAPASQGRGYAAEALTVVLDHLFGTLGKHRVFATTDAENLPAAALFLRLGFRREAHFVENVWFKGAYGSELLFALLGSEWRRQRAE